METGSSRDAEPPPASAPPAAPASRPGGDHHSLLIAPDVVYRMSPDWSEMRGLDGGSFLADIGDPSHGWIHGYIPADEQPTVRAAIDKAVRSKGTFELEHRVNREDGTVGWTLSRALPVLDKTGEIQEWIGVASDVTTRRVEMGVLIATRDRYSELVTSMDAGFCVIELYFDADDHATDWRYPEVNPVFERITGLVDAVGQNVRSMIPGLESLWFDLYGQVALTGVPVRHSDEVAALDRWYDLYVFRTGRPDDRHVAVLFYDVTEQKRSARAVHDLNESLVALNATLEEQVETRTAEVHRLAGLLTVAEQTERERIAEVLHDDLQQQLYGLSMLVASLKRTGEDRDDVSVFAGRAAEIISGATRLTRSLATELAPAVLRTDNLHDLLNWIATRKKQRYGLDVTVEVEGEPSVADPAFRVLLYRGLCEVLLNVSKHAGVPQARLIGRAEGNLTVVRVEDDGAGFDPERTRLDTTGGLGLFSTRDRLTLVGGRFDIESAIGQGTRVTLAIPAGAARLE